VEFVFVAVEVVLQIAADTFAVVCNWVGYVETVKMDGEMLTPLFWRLLHCLSPVNVTPYTLN
jgi:hypothetical protein